MTDSPVTFDLKILKNSTCFRPQRAVGFDRAGGAIESNCPSGSKTCRIFQNFHVESDVTVRHFDGLRYKLVYTHYLFSQYLVSSSQYRVSPLGKGRRGSVGSVCASAPPVCRKIKVETGGGG